MGIPPFGYGRILVNRIRTVASLFLRQSQIGRERIYPYRTTLKHLPLLPISMWGGEMQEHRVWS